MLQHSILQNGQSHNTILLPIHQTFLSPRHKEPCSNKQLPMARKTVLMTRKILLLWSPPQAGFMSPWNAAPPPRHQQVNQQTMVNQIPNNNPFGNAAPRSPKQDSCPHKMLLLKVHEEQCSRLLGC